MPYFGLMRRIQERNEMSLNRSVSEGRESKWLDRHIIAQICLHIFEKVTHKGWYRTLGHL